VVPPQAGFEPDILLLFFFDFHSHAVHVMGCHPTPIFIELQDGAKVVTIVWPGSVDSLDAGSRYGAQPSNRVVAIDTVAGLEVHSMSVVALDGEDQRAVK